VFPSPQETGVTRRKVFDPATVPRSFWRRNEVQGALARRDVAQFFRFYLESFTGCTQTQLALLTEHDRSDISNWVRGARHAHVSDIDVLTRIAEGLCMPDDVRVLIGLAPADSVFSSIRAERTLDAEVGSKTPSDGAARSRLVGSPTTSHRIAICGSRAPGTNGRVIDAAVRSLARLVITRNLLVNHGPVGVGIEVMTDIADRYRPPGLRGVVALFGRRNIVFDADHVIVVGGGQGTQDEVDLALSMDRPVLALPASGGTAHAVHSRLSREKSLRTRIPETAFSEIDQWPTIDEASRESVIETMADDFVRIIDGLVVNRDG
jgi:hypothetical protein